MGTWIDDSVPTKYNSHIDIVLHATVYRVRGLVRSLRYSAPGIEMSGTLLNSSLSTIFRCLQIAATCGVVKSSGCLVCADPFRNSLMLCKSLNVVRPY